MPDNTLSTLDKIKKKVRLLTNNLSVNQLSDSDLTDYINTFVLYDFPQSVQLLTLKKNLTFYTQPFVDTYQNNTVNPSDPLYNLNNKYLFFEPNVWVNGSPVGYTQLPVQMYNNFPDIPSVQIIGSGDDSTTLFEDFVNGIGVDSNESKILRNSVIFSSLDTNNNPIVVIDDPQYDADSDYPLETGDLVNQNDPSTIVGDINYLTGEYSVDFTDVPGDGKDIYLQIVKYQAAKPSLVMFFDNKFVIRPVPDKTYKVEVLAHQRPMELVNNNSPEIAAWFQYIAAGAANKFYEENSDVDGMQRMLSIMDTQQELILTSTVRMLNNQPPTSLINNNTVFRRVPWRQ